MCIRDRLRAEEALTYYTETFKDSKQGHFERYAEGQGAPGTVVGSLMYGDVQLDGQWLAAMDSPFAGSYTHLSGSVKKEYDEADRRTVVIMMTAAGSEAFDRMNICLLYTSRCV